MKNIFKKIIIKILQKEAEMVLKKFKPTIVAITGSVGKTSTKDAIYAVLSKFYFVRKSEKSFNSEFGVPLTILGCQNGWNNPIAWFKNIFFGFSLLLSKSDYPKWLVLEIGADKPGDIKEITKWIKPDIVVITTIGEIPAHIEFFKSSQDVIKEKGTLVNALKSNGIAILNADDKNFEYFKTLTESKMYSYGIINNADVVASHSSIFYAQKDQVKIPDGITFKINYKGNSFPLSICGVVGSQIIYPIIAAFTVGISQNLNIIEIIESISNYISSNGRMKIIEGEKQSVIIDDSYNSSPLALNNAEEVMQKIITEGKKIAVLGDMLELGEHTITEHKKAGMKAAEIFDILITVGLRARYFAEGALNANMDESKIFQFEDSSEAGKYLETIIGKGDIILVKGSQATRMEKVVKEIMANPEESEKLLVRQEEEWRKR